MEILVNRKWKKDSYTIGVMYVNGQRFSETLEDKDRGLTDAMSLEETRNRKVYRETAIPAGTYDIKMTYSPKFSQRAWGRRYEGKVPELMSVKGYSGVRIHPMNKPQDTLGCIGVGRNTVKGGITQSTSCYYKLLDNHILPAIKRGEKITITIK